MYTLRILIVILSVTLYPLSAMFAQINVYTQGCNSLTTLEYDNGNAFNAGCYELPNSNGQIYSTSTQKEVVAEDYILLEGDVEFTASGSGQADLRIAPSPFDVVAYVPDLNSVPKLSKFELGIKPPESIITQVQNFLASTGNNELNPFMSDEIHIKAEFRNETTITIPHPIEPYEVTEETVKIRDGFFTKEVERDISGFDDLYNHPYLENSGFYWDPGGWYEEHPDSIKYQELGGGWTESFSEYPFRIRFAPPKIGTWECDITISVENGNQVFQAPTFTFEVIESNIKGYLKVDKNQRFLKREGETYRPVGVNAPWPIRRGWPLLPYGEESEFKIINQPQRYAVTAPIAVYEQYLRNMDTLAMNGVNYFRLIMNSFSLDIEYEKLGDYSDRMHIAKEMDLIVERAEQNDMLIHWNLMLHNMLQTNGSGMYEWDWSDEPHPDNPNTPTGAYCYNTQINDVNTPLDFLTKDSAKEYYKEKLRYIVARWGYSPNIGMFEHFSEIDQIGKKYKYENDEQVQGSQQYFGNEAAFSDWHGEMSYYLKEELGIPQLLTLSYTLDHNPELDHSFWHGNIDVINVNQYNHYTSNVHGFHKDIIPERIANYGDFESGTHLWGNYDKPLFFSETGAHQLWGCDNFIETRRNIWQNMFWGIAGALDWEHEILPEEIRNLDIYSRVDEFTQEVNLEDGDWHSGMVKLDNQGGWEYKESYHDDCIRNDETADLVYLRSGDKEKAFGVITNRRANYYTLGEGECADDEFEPFLPSNFDLQSYGSVEPEGLNERLRLRNMKFGREYKIKYYSPYDQVNSIKEETKFGSKITLDFPEMDTLDIVLFEAFLMGDNFKSLSSDSTNIEKRQSRMAKDETIDEVLVYPNPNDGSFTVKLQSTTDVKNIEVVDQLGNLVKTKRDVQEVNHFNSLNLSNGIYWVKVVFNDIIIYKKIVVH